MSNACQNSIKEQRYKGIKKNSPSHAKPTWKGLCFCFVIFFITQNTRQVKWICVIFNNFAIIVKKIQFSLITGTAPRTSFCPQCRRPRARFDTGSCGRRIRCRCRRYRRRLPRRSLPRATGLAERIPPCRCRRA